MPEIQSDKIRAHVRFLADDLLEGRDPGSRGGALAARYIAGQMELAGLQPANGDSFYQMVPLVGMTADPGMKLQIRKSERQILNLDYKTDFIAWAGVEQETVRLQGADLVFVGYGITAPEYSWNDYKGRDVREKVLLMLVNDPPSAEPDFFGGEAMTYYGRWTYKLEEAARQGAAGVIFIHNAEMASYPWGVVASSWSGEQFALPQEEEQSTIVEAWIQQEHADALLREVGLGFEVARELASTVRFEPIPLGMQVSVDIDSEIRRIESPNVIGKLEGSDSRLKDEHILITSHYDHLGVGVPVNGDSIYNGALDNASGTAGLLELARVTASLPQRPRRTILFAAVTAEEQGLLGSAYYARYPLVPLAETVANINFDSINVWDETSDIVTMGAERSSLEQVVQGVAQDMGMEIAPDPFPGRGSFFRSDQFSLVKVAIPAVYLYRGVRYRGKPEGWGEALSRDYNARHYHQPSDEFDPSWSFQGAAQMMDFALRTALEVASHERAPSWKAGDPFGKLRTSE